MNKRVKILPYVTMNVGKSGVSFTVGPKGKTLNVSSTGVTASVGLGQGVGYSKRILTWKNLLPGKAGKGKAKAGTAEGQGQDNTAGGGFSWGCLLGAIAVVIIIILLVAVVYLLLTRGV